MIKEQSDNTSQDTALKVFGFITSESRKNLILGIMLISWGLVFGLGYGWYRCELQHKQTIERLVTKYETKIEILYEKIINSNEAKN